MIDFNSVEDAFSWMKEQLKDEDCIDNERFCYLDDFYEYEYYLVQQDDGCCGFFDETITINGRKAMIGCNYGH